MSTDAKNYAKMATKLELKAREAAQMGPDWWPWLFEAGVGHVICTGAVVPYKTRGVDKGCPNWRKMDRATIRKVCV